MGSFGEFIEFFYWFCGWIRDIALLADILMYLDVIILLCFFHIIHESLTMCLVFVL